MSETSANRRSSNKKAPVITDEKEVTTVEESTPVMENSVTEAPVIEEVPADESTINESGIDSRIPGIVAEQSILKNFFERYLEALDEIAAYNKLVLAESESEWNATKVLAKSVEMASNEDANLINQKVKEARDAFERISAELSKARRNLIDVTAAELGISLNVTDTRDPEAEKPLKEKRTLAVEIGKQLKTIAQMTTDESAATAVDEFLVANPMPAIGRDQVRSFTSDGKATPKYRVVVTVKKDGKELLSEKGFTKAAQQLTNPIFGYERGKAPKSDDLRAAWEKAGNTPEKTVQSTVEFEDGELHYTITKN